MKRFAIWGVVLLTVINVASLATIGYYRFMDGDKERHRSSRRPSLEQALGLSAAQVEQMDALKKTLEGKLDPLINESRARREHFYQIIMAPDPDRAQIDQVRIEIDSLQAEIKKHVIDHMLAQKEILTPAQQEQYFSLMKKRYSNGNRRR